MNSADELKLIAGSTIVGAGYVPQKDVLFIFTDKANLAIRVEGGVLIWEVFDGTPH